MNTNCLVKQRKQRTIHIGIIMYGETWGSTIEISKQYSNSDDSELSLIFQFEHILLEQQPGKEKWDLKPLELLYLKGSLSRWQVELEGTVYSGIIMIFQE